MHFMASPLFASFKYTTRLSSFEIRKRCCIPITTACHIDRIPTLLFRSVTFVEGFRIVEPKTHSVSIVFFADHLSLHQRVYKHRLARICCDDVRVEERRTHRQRDRLDFPFLESNQVRERTVRSSVTITITRWFTE